MTESPLFYTLPEAAVLLRRSTKTVRRLITAGELRRDPTISRILIPRQDIQRYVERRGKSIAAGGRGN